MSSTTIGVVVVESVVAALIVGVVVVVPSVLVVVVVVLLVVVVGLMRCERFFCRCEGKCISGVQRRLSFCVRTGKPVCHFLCAFGCAGVFCVFFL